MIKIDPKLIAVLFGLAAVLFFLPFIQVSIHAPKEGIAISHSIKGIEGVVGLDIRKHFRQIAQENAPVMSASDRADIDKAFAMAAAHVPALLEKWRSPFLILAFVLALVGASAFAWCRHHLYLLYAGASALGMGAILHDLGSLHVFTGIASVPQAVSQLSGMGIDLNVNILVVYFVLLLFMVALGASLYMLADTSGSRIASMPHARPQVADMAPPQNASASLQIISTDPALPRITLMPGIDALIGRSPSATVRLDNSHVSSRHLQLRLETHGRVTVTDLGSTNGTYINGKKLDPGTPVELRRGEHLVIGSEDVVYVF
jgi:hypothetical protein